MDQGLRALGQKRIMVLPYQIRAPLLVFLQFAAIFTHLNIYFTTVQGQFWSKLCMDNGNYTDDSLYRKNLDTVLYNLKGTNNGYGFFNSSAGESRGGPDAAYAVALCGGHVGPDNCLRCVDNATLRLRQECPYQREAAGWYDNCLLKYSNITLLHTLDRYKPGLHKWSSNVSELDDEFIKSMENLFPRLKEEAAKGGPLQKYAVGNTMNLYGLVQCTPDLSEEQCNECLTESYQYCLNNSETISRKCYRPNCLLRYDVIPLLYDYGGDPSPPDAPQPSPSPSENSPPTPDEQSPPPPDSSYYSPPPTDEPSPPPSDTSDYSPPPSDEQSPPPESSPSPPHSPPPSTSPPHSLPPSPSPPAGEGKKTDKSVIIGPTVSVGGLLGISGIGYLIKYVFCQKRGGQGQDGGNVQQPGVQHNTWNLCLCPVYCSPQREGNNSPVRSNSV